MTRWKTSLVGVMIATGIVATACEQTRDLDATASSSESMTTGESGERRAPRSPPKEAFDACQGLAESAACTVQFGDRAIEGVCRKGPDGQGELACAPNHPPPGGPPGPPKEAFDACQGLAESAACTVQLGDKSIEGACRKGPDGQGELACAPNHPPPGGPPPQ